MPGMRDVEQKASRFGCEREEVETEQKGLDSGDGHADQHLTWYIHTYP